MTPAVQSASEGELVSGRNNQKERLDRRQTGNQQVVSGVASKNAIPVRAQQQQQQQQQQCGLSVCPVPVGDNIPAGKLHKSLLSQVLAALATCRKLPQGHKHRAELDRLLQRALALAHEAVVAWSSAATIAQLEPEQHYALQQQQQQQLSATCEQQKAEQAMHAAEPSAAPKKQKHVRWLSQPTVCIIPAPSDSPLASKTPSAEGFAITADTDMPWTAVTAVEAPANEPTEPKASTPAAAESATQPGLTITADKVKSANDMPLAPAVAVEAPADEPKASTPAAAEIATQSRLTITADMIISATDMPLAPAVAVEAPADEPKASTPAAAKVISATEMPLAPAVAVEAPAEECNAPTRTAAESAAALQAGKEQLAAFVQGIDLGPLLEFSWASRWSRSTSSCGTGMVAATQQSMAQQKGQLELQEQQEQQEQQDMLSGRMTLSTDGLGAEIAAQQQYTTQQQQEQEHLLVSRLAAYREGAGLAVSMKQRRTSSSQQDAHQQCSSGSQRLLAERSTFEEQQQSRRLTLEDDSDCFELYNQEAGSKQCMQNDATDESQLQHDHEQQQAKEAWHSPDDEEELRQFRQYSRSLGGCDPYEQARKPQGISQCSQRSAGAAASPYHNGSNAACDGDQQEVCGAFDVQPGPDSTADRLAVYREGSHNMQGHCSYDAHELQVQSTLPATECQHLMQQEHKQQLSQVHEMPAQTCQQPSAQEQQNASALDTAWSIGSVSPDYVSSAVPDTCADPEIASLVQILTSGDLVLQRAAANALMNLAFNSADSRAVIAEAGAIEPLVAMLNSTSRSCQVSAAGALSNLCIDNAENQAAIAELGGVQILSSLLSSSSASVQRAAARALNNLAWDIDNRVVIAAAGGVPWLVNLLGSKCDDIKEHAAATLMNMARDMIFGIPAAIAEAGGIPALVRLLHSSCSDEVKDSAAGALMNLAYSTPGNRAAIAAAGGIIPLVTLLTSKNKCVQRSAAGALKNLSRGSPDNQAAIAEAGGIPVLVWIMKGSREDVSFEAAGALWNLIHNNPENQDELAAAGGIQPLMDLMDSM